MTVEVAVGEVERVAQQREFHRGNWPQQRQEPKPDPLVNDVVELHRGMWVAHPSAECDHSRLATPAMHPASPVTKADTMYGSAGVGDTEIPADAEVRGPDGDDQ